MDPHGSRVESVKLAEIEKSAALGMGFSSGDVGKYERLAAAYGNVEPVVLGEAEGGGRTALSGGAWLAACAKSGIRVVQAVVAGAKSEVEQIKLALMLSVTRGGGALGEGELISALVEKHGCTVGGLSKLIGKSKSWVSKRRSLAEGLSSQVKEMVACGLVCPRTAEEVAKLPEGVQLDFASSIVREGLRKTDAEALVRAYRSPGSSEELKSCVIADPAAALPILTEKARRASGGKGGRSDRQRLASAVSWSIRSLREALLQLNSSNPGEFAEAELPLKQLEQTLRESFWAVCMALLKLGDRSAMLDEWRRLLGALGVSPGKQEKSG